MKVFVPKKFGMLKYLLLSLLAIANCYDRDYLLECWDIYDPNIEKDKLSLCVKSRHYQTMWEECAFNNYNN